MFFLLIIVGLIVGSFLGALTWRVPRGTSILKGRSQCPKCHKTISWHDNIPLLSYFVLRGRCRNCRHKISRRYPLIELATVIGFVGLWALQGLPLQKLTFLLFVFTLLVTIFVIDLEHRIIPDELVFLGFLATALFFLFTNSPTFYQNFLVGFVLADFLLFVHLVTGGRGMGLGDVKLALFMGTFFGWPMGFVWMFASFLIGGAFGLILILLGRAGLRQRIAFGPFLVIGAIVTFVFGKNILLFFA